MSISALFLAVADRIATPITSSRPGITTDTRELPDFISGQCLRTEGMACHEEAAVTEGSEDTRDSTRLAKEDTAEATEIEGNNTQSYQ